MISTRQCLKILLASRVRSTTSLNSEGSVCLDVMMTSRSDCEYYQVIYEIGYQAGYHRPVLWVLTRVSADFSARCQVTNETP